MGWQIRPLPGLPMPDHPFAVAARSFDKASETFIRHHATALAPGRTALLQVEPGAPDPALVPGPCLTAFPERTSRWFSRNSAEKRTAAFLRDQGVRTLLAEYGQVGVAVAPAAAMAGCRLFVHFHGHDATSYVLRPGVRDRYAALFAQAEGLFTPSRYIAERLAAIGAPRDRITVSPCGVDPGRFPPGRPAPGRLLSVGRLVEKKSPLSTLRAFRLARAEAPGLRLDMVGDGPLLEPARAFVAEAGLGDAVTLHGAQPHGVVQRLMSEASIFLQHSVTASTGDCEGLPVAVLEAMSAALPVVSTWHSGIPEAVVEGETGRLVMEYDVQGMAAAILDLHRNAARAAAMGAAGRQRVLGRFTQKHTVSILRGAMGLPD